MAVTPLRMLLFLGGATAAAVGTAFYTGALDPLLGKHVAAPAPEIAKAPPVTPEVQTPVAPEKQQEQAAISPVPEAAPKPVQQPSASAQLEPSPPTFDILRVEPDGSIVIAGKASPNAEVEILSGSKVLGKVKATVEGDFAAALDNPLKPGDYQIVLRSTTPSHVVANSKETAVVAIPETKDGQVLALVEQPGAPSRLITKPEAPKVPQPTDQAAAQPSMPEPAPQGETTTAQPPAQKPQPAKTANAAPAANVAVDAVEIEGRKIFVAGSSDPGKTVRIYANDILLGDAKTSPEGRFLIETERDLPVGDYVVRADVLGPDGAKVIARAAVPFSREPGENISAVAPQKAAPTEAPSTAAGVTTSNAQSAPTAGAASPQDSTPEQTGAKQPDASSGATTTSAPSSETMEQPTQQAATPESGELAPKLESVDGSVIIRRGDSLWRISKRVYGRGVRYSTIYLANQEQIKDPDMIWPGQTFRVPEKTEEGEKADMEAIKKPAPTTVQ